MSKTKSSVANSPQKTKLTLRCPMCGYDGVAQNKFYKSSSPLYASNYGYMGFCKVCVLRTYDTYFDVVKDIDVAIEITCMKFDIPFSDSEIEGTKKELVTNQDKNPMSIYMTKLNSLGSFNNEFAGFDPKFIFSADASSAIKGDITEALQNEVRELDANIQLNEQDLQVKDDVVRLLGYDPFAGYSNFDQKFLYNELLTYLDEDTLDDSFKLSQILQLVNNNNQVRKIDLIIANMSNDVKSMVANQGEIKSLTGIKKNIVDNTDKIAKENSISVKNRGDKSAGKSTITYQMKNYRELGFEDAEQDYYDQQKAHGMKLVVDISHKSILEQLQFDDNDTNDMFFMQREMITNLQNKMIDLEEENRKLHAKISSLRKSEVN